MRQVPDVIFVIDPHREDIAITGEGVIDGAGQAWRPVKKAKMTAGQWTALLASGGVVDKAGTTWWPSLQALNGADTVKASISCAARLIMAPARRAAFTAILSMGCI